MAQNKCDNLPTQMSIVIILNDVVYTQYNLQKSECKQGDPGFGVHEYFHAAKDKGIGTLGKKSTLSQLECQTAAAGIPASTGISNYEIWRTI